MTFKRYQALKENWKESPPVATCLAAILRMLGMEPKGNGPVQNTAGDTADNGDYYDEDYYNVKTQPGALGALGNAFSQANGGD